MSSSALRHRDATLPAGHFPVDGPADGRGDGLPAVDLVHLARQTLGDRDLEADLLGLFVHQARALLGLLDAAARGPGDGTARAADPVHTLCGSARAVGCWQVAAEAEKLERLLRAPSAPPGPLAPARVANLAAAVNRAVAEIEHVLGG